MKKFFIAALLSLATLTGANAQRFGLTVGLNESKIANEDADNLTGFNAGIKFDDDLASTKLGNFFIEGSLLYSRQGYHFETSSVSLLGKTLKYEYDEKLSYIQLPIYFGHNFKFGQNFSVAPKFGVYFACGLTGETENNIYNSDDDDDKINPFSDLEDYDMDNYKRFDFGINAGINFDLFQHLQLSTGYQWGCLEYTDSYDDAKNRNFFVNLAYMF